MALAAAGGQGTYIGIDVACTYRNGHHGRYGSDFTEVGADAYRRDLLTEHKHKHEHHSL